MYNSINENIDEKRQQSPQHQQQQQQQHNNNNINYKYKNNLTSIQYLDSMISSIEHRENDEDADNESDISNDFHLSLELKKYQNRSNSKKKLHHTKSASTPTHSISSQPSPPSNSPLTILPQYHYHYPQQQQQQQQQPSSHSPIPFSSSSPSYRRKSYTPPAPPNLLFIDACGRVSPTSQLNVNPLYNSTGSLGSSTSTNNNLLHGDYSNSSSGAPNNQYSNSPMVYRVSSGNLPPFSTSPTPSSFTSNNLFNTPLKRSISNSSIMFTPQNNNIQQPFTIYNSNNNNINNNNNLNISPTSSLYSKSISSNSSGSLSSPLTFSALISPSPTPSSSQSYQHHIHHLQKSNNSNSINSSTSNSNSNSNSNNNNNNNNNTPTRSKIKKAPSFCGYPQRSILMDSSFILAYGHQDISTIIALELSNSNIKSVNNEKFELFDKLIYIDLNNNFVQFSPFSNIPNLCELYLSNNQIENLQFNNGFKSLTKLDLSNNLINSKDIKYLLKLEKLVCLNLSFNKITILPDDMSSLQSLETLYLESCYLSLKTSTLQSLSTIPNLRLLNLNNNQWDRILPIDGVFRSLIELSLCNNFISNLYSIGNLYHTSYPLLTRVQLYGNPLKSTQLSLPVSKSIQLITTQPSISPTSSTSSLSSNQTTPSKLQPQQDIQSLFSTTTPTKKRSTPNKSQSTSSIDRSSPLPSKLRDSDPLLFSSNFIKQQSSHQSTLPSHHHHYHHHHYHYYQQQQQLQQQQQQLQNYETQVYDFDEETYSSNNINNNNNIGNNNNNNSDEDNNNNQYYNNSNDKELSLSDLTIN